MESIKNQTELPGNRLLPQGGKKDGAVALKSVSASLTFGEMIFHAVMKAMGASKRVTPVNPDSGSGSGSGGGSASGGSPCVVDGRDALESSVEFIISLLSFGCSLGVGYGCYSPMDVTEEMKKSHPEYAEKIQQVNDTAHAYTIMWWIKSLLSMFADGTNVVLFFMKSTSKGGKWLAKGAKGINTAVHGAALITECVADGYAGSVNTGGQNTDYADEDIDKKVFLCDTTGYIFFDAKSIMDNLYDLGLENCLEGYGKLIFVGCRELFAIGCGVSESVATSYINGTLK